MCRGDTQVCRPSEDTATASSLPPGSPGAALSGCSVCARIDLRRAGACGTRRRESAMRSWRPPAACVSAARARVQQGPARRARELRRGAQTPISPSIHPFFVIQQHPPAFEEGDVGHGVL